MLFSTIMLSSREKYAGMIWPDLQLITKYPPLEMYGNVTGAARIAYSACVYSGDLKATKVKS
jgi:hypothetical protein